MELLIHLDYTVDCYINSMCAMEQDKFVLNKKEKKELSKLFDDIKEIYLKRRKQNIMEILCHCFFFSSSFLLKNVRTNKRVREFRVIHKKAHTTGEKMVFIDKWKSTLVLYYISHSELCFMNKCIEKF